MQAPPPWRVDGVDHLALVNGYYHGIRVRATSLQPPACPFFSKPSASDIGTDNRANKKRKKLVQQQKQLQDLIARGKFVPLDNHLVNALEKAHESVLRMSSWKPRMGDAGPETNDVEATDVHQVISDAHANDPDTLKFIQDRAGSLYVMPLRSRFIIGDVRTVLSADAAPALGKFQLIVMDPPWENKSVDRKRCYSTFHHRELLKIDIPSLSATPVDGGEDDGGDGCVLAMWVTNRPTYMDFILQELLPAWGFTYHATWYWLKVCKNGELVSPLSSTHRLPVEKLVVATRTHSADARELLCSRLGCTPKVVVSVPLRHSWKPPPESYFPSDVFTGRKLEVFARELRPHFVSVGNEPLKFQAVRLFEPAATDTST